MAKQNTKKSMNETTALALICGIVLSVFGVVAFWYVKVYSQDPMVVLSKQAPALDMHPPMESGKTQVLSPDLTEYTNTPTGSTVSFHDYNFTLSGTLEAQTGSETSDSMMVSYTMDEEGGTHQANFTLTTLSQYNEDIKNFLENGDMTLFTTAFNESSGDKYYYKYAVQYIPMVVNTTLNQTYMVVPKVDTDECLLIQSADPVTITSGMATKLYRKTEDTLYSQRVFSSYEIAAVNNTRNQALGTDGSMPMEEAIPTDDFESTSEAEESTAKYTHEQLVEIDDHLTRERLKDDGSIAGTTIQLSTDSEAEADITTGNIPVITTDGLKLDNISFQYDAAKTNDVLTFKGLTPNVQNTVDITNMNNESTEFVLLVKFVSTDNRILDFVKLSNLNSPLEPNEKRTFDMALTDVKYSGTLQKIQIEVWR